MKYKIIKKNGWWSGYVWDEKRGGWDWIIDSFTLTKLGCKRLVKKYHKRFKSNCESKFEEFELE